MAEVTICIDFGAKKIKSVTAASFPPSVYHEAMEIELRKRNIPFESKSKIRIQYKDVPMEHFYIADFVCYGKIIVELKAVSDILPEHEAQIINYLRATGFKLGILLNFDEESLFYKRYPNISAQAKIRTHSQR